MKPEQLKFITDTLIMMMEDHGIIIDDYNNMRNFIYHAFNDDRIKFFNVNGKQAGFVIWEAINFGDGVDIVVNKLLVLPEFRPLNIFKEMSSIRKRYRKIYKVIFHRQIGNEFLPKVRILQKEYANEPA